jgi:hypothetical protein
MNEKLKSRLVNWKFSQALNHLDDELTAGQRELIEALARLVGDSGWFEGDIGVLVALAVAALTGPESALAAYFETEPE